MTIRKMNKFDAYGYGGIHLTDDAKIAETQVSDADYTYVGEALSKLHDISEPSYEEYKLSRGIAVVMFASHEDQSRTNYEKRQGHYPEKPKVMVDFVGTWLEFTRHVSIETVCEKIDAKDWAWLVKRVRLAAK